MVAWRPFEAVKLEINIWKDLVLLAILLLFDLFDSIMNYSRFSFHVTSSSCNVRNIIVIAIIEPYYVATTTSTY